MRSGRTGYAQDCHTRLKKNPVKPPRAAAFARIHEEALIHQVEGSEYVPYPFDISPEEIATAFDETAMSEADVLQSIVDAMNETISKS